MPRKINNANLYQTNPSLPAESIRCLDFECRYCPCANSIFGFQSIGKFNRKILPIFVSLSLVFLLRPWIYLSSSSHLREIKYFLFTHILLIIYWTYINSIMTLKDHSLCPRQIRDEFGFQYSWAHRFCRYTRWRWQQADWTKIVCHFWPRYRSIWFDFGYRDFFRVESS